MKLYTEEQVIKALTIHSSNPYLSEVVKDKILNYLTPIELPSDEEIEKEALSYFNEKHCNVFEYDAFIAGAKWVIDKIKNQ